MGATPKTSEKRQGATALHVHHHRAARRFLDALPPRRRLLPGLYCPCCACLMLDAPCTNCGYASDERAES